MTDKTSNILIGQAILYNNLSYDLLKRLDYTDEDIEFFLSTGLLDKIDDKNYYISDENELINYYDKRLRRNPTFKHNLEHRAKVLDMILFAKPNSTFGLYQRYYVALRQGDFETAYDCFKKFYQPTDIMNTHLFLLSKVTKLDDKHLKIVEDIDPKKNLFIKDVKRKQDRFQVKSIRENIVRNDYKNASDGYYDLISDKHLTQEEEFTSLIGRESYYTLFDQYMMRNDYEKGLEYIKNSKYMSPGRKAARQILEFLNNPPDPIEIDVYHKEGLWEAISANDYVYALLRHQKYVETTGKNDETTRMITTLLKKAVAYILNFSEEELEQDPNIYKPPYINLLMEQGMDLNQALEFSKFDDESINYTFIQYALKAIDEDRIDDAEYYLSLCNIDNIKDENNKELYFRVVDSRKLYDDYKIHIPDANKLVRIPPRGNN